MFITSSVLIVGFIIFGSLFSETAATLFSFLQAFIAEKFRWLFIILFNMALVFCIYLTASRYGDFMDCNVVFGGHRDWTGVLGDG